MAVKIKTAETSVDTSELSILSYLKQKGTSDPMSKHVIALLDHFEHQGPNGKHACIVSEALGASVSTVLTTCPKYFHGYRMFFPKWMVKRILRQVLMGICFLHSHGVIHGDLHMGNILFAAPSPDSYTAKELEHDETMKSVVITRPNRTYYKCAPRYIAMTSLLIKHCYDGSDLTVKITDLGGGKFMANTNIYKRLFNSDLAFTFGDTSKNPETPQCLRAPERIFGNPLDQSIDIWSFGCLMFELLTAMSLFPIMPGQGKDHHILMMVDALGPLPERLLSQWDQAHRYFRSNGEQFNSMVDGPDIELLPPDSLETLFHREKRCEFDAGEEESVIDILKQILRYEPEKRPSAEKLLSHPWFADIGT